MAAIQKILCPIDFFDASTAALKYAVALAASHDAHLKVIHIVSPTISNPSPYMNDSIDLTGPMKAAAEKQLHKLLASLKLKRRGILFDSEVLLGEVDLAIKTIADIYKPDLITMGTHGRGGFQRWFLGSTTERLLRHSPVPLLTIAAPRKAKGDVSRFRRILVTTDFSEGTSEALDYAFTIAQENDAKLTLLHIVDRQPTEFKGEERAIYFREIRRQLADLVPPDVTNWCDVKVRVERGIPYQVVLDLVAKDKVDLVVMNIHGKGMLERALLGSTAERVVRAARCPIFLIPPMKKEGKKGQSGKRVA